jgi:hypothetical protein
VSEACISVAVANGVEPDSWLNDPEYDAFRAAYVYAANQTAAIPGLSLISAERYRHLNRHIWAALAAGQTDLCEVRGSCEIAGDGLQ